MITLIIFIALFLFNLGVIFISIKTDEVESAVAFGYIELFVGVILGLMIYGAVTADVRWAQFKAEYEATKGIVETYHPYYYGNTIDITRQMFEINSTIAKNKARYDNKFYNIWYSEEVANLEPLKFKRVDND